MPLADLLQEFESLIEKIDTWNHQYYVLDQPTVPDAEYDRAMRRLIELEAQHPQWLRTDSPTQRVGAQPLTQFGQVTHDVPMLSLDNAFNDEDMQQFNRRLLDRLADNAGPQPMQPRSACPAPPWPPA